MTVVLRGNAIHQKLGRRTVLRGVDIELGDGELVAILGPNGAGKTTLLAILAGQRKPTSGQITGPPPARRGWVPQIGGVWARLTVRENLATFARLNKAPSGAVAEAAADVGLDDRLDSLAANLSGGMRQRLNIACGLIANPPILLLDEPTTGLDLIHRAELWKIVKARSARGTSIAFSTHSIDDALEADRVAVISDGRIAFSGPPAGLAQFAGTNDTSHEAVAAGLVALWQQAGGGA